MKKKLWNFLVSVKWEDLTETQKLFTPISSLIDGEEWVELDKEEADTFQMPYLVTRRYLGESLYSCLRKSDNYLVFVNDKDNSEFLVTHELQDALDDTLMLSYDTTIVGCATDKSWVELSDSWHPNEQDFVLALTDDQYDNLSYLNLEEIQDSVRGIVKNFKEDYDV